MNDTTPASNDSQKPGTVRLVHKVTINGTIEQVWYELTRTDTVQRAFFDAQLHTHGLAVGNKIAMRTKDGKYTSVVGEVLEIDPPHRYVISFRFTAFDDAPCRVIHELREVPGGVEYTLTSTDIPAGSKTAKHMSSGGAWITSTMKRMVETGKPSFGIRLLWSIFAILGKISTPARCKSEHWPL